MGGGKAAKERRRLERQNKFANNSQAQSSELENSINYNDNNKNNNNNNGSNNNDNINRKSNNNNNNNGSNNNSDSKGNNNNNDKNSKNKNIAVSPQKKQTKSDHKQNEVSRGRKNPPPKKFNKRKERPSDCSSAKPKKSKKPKHLKRKLERACAEGNATLQSEIEAQMKQLQEQKNTATKASEYRGSKNGREGRSCSEGARGAGAGELAILDGGENASDDNVKKDTCEDEMEMVEDNIDLTEKRSETIVKNDTLVPPRIVENKKTLETKPINDKNSESESDTDDNDDDGSSNVDKEKSNNKQVKNKKTLETKPIKDKNSESQSDSDDDDDSSNVDKEKSNSKQQVGKVKIATKTCVVSPSSQSDDSSDSDSDSEDATNQHRRQRGRGRKARKESDAKRAVLNAEAKLAATTSPDKTMTLKSSQSNMDSAEDGEKKDLCLDKESSNKKDTRRCIGRKPVTDFEVGTHYDGKVVYLKPFGAFIDIGCHSDAFCHVSRVQDDFVGDITDVLSVGDTVRARVVRIERRKKRVTVSLQSDAKLEDEERATEKYVEILKKRKSAAQHDDIHENTEQDYQAFENNPSTSNTRDFDTFDEKITPPPVVQIKESEMTPAQLKRARKLERRAARRALQESAESSN